MDDRQRRSPNQARHQVDSTAAIGLMISAAACSVAVGSKSVAFAAPRDITRPMVIPRTRNMPAIVGSNVASESAQHSLKLLAEPALRAGLVGLVAAQLVAGRRRGSRRLVVVPRQFGDVEDFFGTGDDEEKLSVGDHVQVVGEGIRLFNCPISKRKAFDPEGLVGEIKKIVEDEHLTLTKNVVVKLIEDADGQKIKPFNVHFEPSELRLKSCDDEFELPSEADELPTPSSSELPTPSSSEAAANSSAQGASASGDLASLLLRCTRQVGIAAPARPVGIGMSATGFVRAGGSTARRATNLKVQEISETIRELNAVVDEDAWIINLLYDGECPTCMKQVEFLSKRMDENPEYKGLVRLTDLACPGYDHDDHGGVMFEDGMQHIHAVTRDGQVFSGVKVFQEVYKAVGMEWVYTITSLPFLGEFFDWAYDSFATNRLQMEGRTDVIARINRHKDKIEELSEVECEVECEIDWDTGEMIQH